MLTFSLCNSVPQLVCEMGFVDIDVHRDSIDICDKFKSLFHKYSICHNMMNSTNYFDDDKIKTLGKSSIVVVKKLEYVSYVNY